MPKARKKSIEFDLHIWAKPEDETMVETFTVSIGKRAICVDTPIERTLEAIRDEMEYQLREA
jgi:hypothetical protein